MIADTAETSSLRDRALAALATRKQLEAEADAEGERREKQREADQLAKYLRDFQTELDRRGFDGVVADGRVVLVEGVTLALRYWREGNGIVALAACRDCGEEREYTHVRNMADFGYVLAEWQAANADRPCSRCEERAYWQSVERERAERTAALEAADSEVVPYVPPPSFEARLVDLLRELIRAEVER